MAESHDGHGAETDPNVAPSHLEVRAQFSSLEVGFCVVLGAVAIVAGLVLGLTLANN